MPFDLEPPTHHIVGTCRWHGRCVGTHPGGFGVQPKNHALSVALIGYLAMIISARVVSFGITCRAEAMGSYRCPVCMSAAMSD